jgi:hypothetical protein
MNILIGSLLSLIFITFLYFGYRDDYKSNKKGFKKTVFGLFGLFILILLGSFLYSFIIEKVDAYYWNDSAISTINTTKSSIEMEAFIKASNEIKAQKDSLHSTIFTIVMMTSAFVFYFWQRFLNQKL